MRRFLAGFVALLLLSAMPLARHPLAASASTGTFTIAVLPDTQKYVAYDKPAERTALFKAQTEWIVANRTTEQIAFVSHEGDITNDGGEQPIEWERAEEAMSVLDGQIPYSTVPGNHDPERPGSVDSTYATYLSHFGPARYAGYSWFGGAAADGLSTYQLFSAGNWQFLHLALELEVPDDAIAWAQGVIDAHPGLPTIITTHAYQDDSTGRTKDSQVQFEGNSGETIWQKLVKPNPQIFMVLNGHFWENGGERHQVSTNAAGLPVYEMQANYQALSNGGDGYMRLIRFDPANNRITVSTYSPALDTFMTDANSAFSFTVDLAKRFQSMPTAIKRTQIVTPVADSYIVESAKTKNYGTSTTLRADKSSGQNEESLLRFSAQYTGTLQSATLRLYTTSSSSNGPAVYATGSGWTETGVTWNNRPARTGSALGNVGSVNSGKWVEYDVTRAIAGPGTVSFVVIGDSTDGIGFSSREGANPPQLVITSASTAPTATPTAAPVTPTATSAVPQPTASPTPVATPPAGPQPTAVPTGTRVVWLPLLGR